jgi:hypothetical protein
MGRGFGKFHREAIRDAPARGRWCAGGSEFNERRSLGGREDRLQGLHDVRLRKESGFSRQVIVGVSGPRGTSRRFARHAFGTEPVGSFASLTLIGVRDVDVFGAVVRMKSLHDIDLGQFIDMTAITTNREDT